MQWSGGPLLRRIARRLRGLLHDPVLYLGGAFLFLLLIQWYNSGRIQLYDWDRQCWTYSSTPYPRLPWAFTREEAREMLYWFFPAWALLLALRSGIRDGRTARRVLLVAVVNAAALAGFGIVQFLSGTRSLLWVFPLKQHFFASFGYSNHAGAFFVLLFGMACAILLREVLDRPVHEPRRSTVILAGSAATLAFCGANLSLSRAAIIMSWSLAAAASIIAAKAIWPALSQGKRLNVIATLIAIALAGYFLVGALGTQAFNAELSGLGQTSAKGESMRRWPQSQAALRIWQDHPWFGVGGWGYRYLLHEYIRENHSGDRPFVVSTGMANVHNDPVQFLAEFGIVGFALLTGTVCVLFAPIVRKRVLLLGSSAALLAGLSLAFILAHSLVDLPFRCPAVLQHWVLLLALSPFLASPKLNSLTR